MVWKGSLTLGCAYASCGASFRIPNGVFVVCRYSPAGNYDGEFGQNVFPAIANPAPVPAPCDGTAAAAVSSVAAGADSSARSAASTTAAAPQGPQTQASSTAVASDATPKCAGAAPPLFADTLLKHNTYRATHQVSALSWDAALAATAAAWASQCNFAHDPANTAGENIYASSAFAITSPALSAAVDVWYAEVSKYDFSTPGFLSGTGHFTQVRCAPLRSAGVSREARQ